jgi:hypothetical protein
MSTRTGSATRIRRSTAQQVAAVVGVVFLLVGILGFIPGITTHYADMTFAGHMSDAKLLGIFEVSILHNLVHLLFGVAGLAMSRTPAGAVSFLVGGGVIYLVLWLYGVLVDQASSANFVPINTADNWLHLLLGLGMVAAGLALRSRQVGSRTSKGY